MKKKNIMIIIMVAIIIVAIGVLTSMYLNQKAKYTYQIEKVTQIDYNIINEEDRYGVIDKNGKVVIEAKYDIIQIPNPAKPIFICMSNYDTEKKEYQTKVLNEKAEQLYIGYESIQAIPTETTADGIPFEKSVLKYKENGKFGLLGMDGKKVTEAIYDSLSAIKYKEGMFLVKQEDKVGIINMNGKNVIPIEYETISADNYYHEETLYQRAGFIVSKKTDAGYRYGYINYKGNIILKPEYTEIERVTEIQDDQDSYLVALKDGQAGLLKNKKVILNYEYEDIGYNSYNDVFVIQRNGKQGIADRKGNIKIGVEYDNILFGGIYINATKNGELSVLDMKGNQVQETDILSKIPTKDQKRYIISDKNEKYKVIDEQGNSVIDKNYSYIEEIENNYYIVANGNKNGIVNLEGKSVVDLKYNSIFELENTNLLQANITASETISLINKQMQTIVTMDKAGIEVTDHYVRIYTETENRYFDKNTGEELNSKQALPNNKLYAKKINEKWGFVDQKGDLKVQNEYDMVTEVNEYGFAGVKKDGKWGVINQEGDIIQEPIYKLTWPSPKFIGKYYQEKEWYGDFYYTNKIKE